MDCFLGFKYDGEHVQTDQCYEKDVEGPPESVGALTAQGVEYPLSSRAFHRQRAHLSSPLP